MRALRRRPRRAGGHAACLDAALASPLPPGFAWRTWVVSDDASTDGTAARARAWAAGSDGPPPEVIAHVRRRGTGHARDAQVGAFALHVAERFPCAEVSCCEPSPHAFGYLRSNVEANGLGARIRLHPAAVGTGEGRVDLYNSGLRSAPTPRCPSPTPPPAGWRWCPSRRPSPRPAATSTW